MEVRHFRLIADPRAVDLLSRWGPFQLLPQQSRWLSAALRIYPAHFPTDLVAVLRKAFAAGHSVGLCAEDFRPRALFFDMDATTIREESLVELARAIGVADEVQAITDHAMNGEIYFANSFLQRLTFLKDADVGIIQEVAGRLTLQPKIKEVVSFAKKLGVPSFLISGGFQPLAEVIAQKVPFAGVRAHHFEVDGGRLTGRIAGPIIDANAKARFVEEQCQKLKINPSDCVAIGDGANDRPMLELCGLACGFQPRSSIWDVIDAATFSDHSLLLPLAFGRILEDSRGDF